MKRPLCWILGVWILGEAVASWLGIPLTGETSLDRAMAERDSAVVRIWGTVEEIHRTSSGYSYVLADNQVYLETQNLDARKILVYTEDIAGLHIGSRQVVTGKLSAFEEPRNPGQFDSRAYYRAQGIDYRLKEEERTVTEDRISLLADGMFRLRECLWEKFQLLASEEEAGVLSAMLTGERSGMDAEIKDLYQQAGISHILAISGLHIAAFGMFFYRFLRRIIPSLTVSALASAGLLVLYVEFVGGSPSAKRALVMFGLSLLALRVRRSYDMLSALAAAGLFVLWQSPEQLWQAGFQLSFLAVFAAGTAAPVFSGESAPGICRNLAMSLAVQLVTAPVVAWHMFTFPVVGLFLNLLILPLTGPLLFFAAAAVISSFFFLPLGRILYFPAHLILTGQEYLCRFSEKIPGHTLLLGRPGLWQIALYYLLLAAAVFAIRVAERRKREREEKTKERKHWRIRDAWMRLAAGFLLLPLLFLLHALPARSAQAVFLDVGQGDCSVIYCGDGKICLIDGGSSSVSSVGKYRILPYLKCNGIRKLEAIFVTHGDEDHINGLTDVLADSLIETETLYIAAVSAEDEALNNLKETAAQAGCEIRQLAAGDGWKWGEMEWICLYPLRDSEASEDRNENSLVLRAENGVFSALFMGDLGEEGERKMIEQGLVSAADILKAGHHGSKYSSSEEFLAMVRPGLAILSCGKNNRYGHPHEETIFRLAEAGSRMLITYETGMITVGSRRGQVIYRRFR